MTPKKDIDYWVRVLQKAKDMKSDGCTKAKDVYVHCCYEHDIHCRFGTTVDGEPITRAEADKQLRECFQQTSVLGKLSPLSWVYWAGVRVGAFKKYLMRVLHG